MYVRIWLDRPGRSHAKTRLTGSADLQADSTPTYVVRLGNRTCTTSWAERRGPGTRAGADQASKRLMDNESPRYQRSSLLGALNVCTQIIKTLFLHSAILG